MHNAEAQSLSILCAEDEAQLRELISTFLREAGHRVMEAADGKEALQLFKQHTFDVVLTDFSMPRMCGDQLAREVRAVAPTQRVVMLTGSPEAIEWAGENPEVIDLLLQKPVTSKALNGAIAALMAGS